jgi:hypothetical protein
MVIECTVTGFRVSLHGWSNVGVGGGAEGFLWHGLTVGLDAGYYQFPAEGNAGYGVLMLGPGYHFVNRKKPVKIDPYVSGAVLGIPIDRVGLARAGSLGGGVNYWFKERLGLQIGGQAQVVNREMLVLFRIGLTFR